MASWGCAISRKSQAQMDLQEYHLDGLLGFPIAESKVKCTNILDASCTSICAVKGSWSNRCSVRITICSRNHMAVAASETSDRPWPLRTGVRGKWRRDGLVQTLVSQTSTIPTQFASARLHFVHVFRCSPLNNLAPHRFVVYSH